MQFYDFKEIEERVILIGVQTEQDEDVAASLDELEELAATAGAVTVGKVIQNREAVHPGTYIGKGKIEEVAALLAAYDADVFLSSANAITSDGVMVNIDGNSNRVSCIAQGPKKVVFIVGMNKVCSDLDAAMKRARNVAAPANAQRFEVKTPCKTTGKCFDCKSPDTICCQFLITRYSRHKDRIHVILVNDTLGF